MFEFFHHPSVAPRSVPPTATLINGAKAAAIGDMSLTWWHEAVRRGHAPAPVIRKPRCTRWRLSDVLAFWEQVAEGGIDTEAARSMVERGQRHGSASAKKRSAKRAGGSA